MSKKKLSNEELKKLTSTWNEVRDSSAKRTKKQKIYDSLSKKICERHERIERAGKISETDRLNGKPTPGPAKVNNYFTNKPIHALHQVKKLEPTVKQRSVSDNEGVPTVNGESGKKYVRPIARKSSTRKDEAGEISATPKNAKTRKTRKKSTRVGGTKKP